MSTISLLALVLAAHGGIGLADGWRKTFVPEAVATYLEREGLGVMVVAAGDASAAEPTSALMTALRVGKRAGVVMDASALGSVAALGDQAICAQAKGLPLDRLFVVRLFAGEPPIAVVSIYDAKGGTLGAMTARRGERLADNQRRASGLSRETASVVDVVIGGGSARTDEAKEELERRALWLEGITSVSANQYGAWSNSWQEPRQGKYGKVLSWSEFFTLVGRQDLSQQIQLADSSVERSRGGWMMGVGGLTALIAGSVFLTGALIDMAGVGGDGVSKLTLVSGALTAGGAGMAFAGSRTYDAAPSYPDVPMDQVREMADEYNHRLARELGLAGSDIAPSTQVFAAPVAGPRFSGAAVAVTF